MKNNYSILFLLVFLIFLVGDTLSHHQHHEIEDKGIIFYEYSQDCNLCLFNNVNSNSYTSNKFNSYNYLDSYEIQNKGYELVYYNRSYDHSISLRGPPNLLWYLYS